MKKRALIFFYLLFTLCLNSYSQWEQMNGPYTGSIQKIFAIKDTLYCVSNFQIYKSINSGENWDSIAYPEGTQFSAINELCHKDSIFIIGGNNGIYKSANYGRTWKKLITNVCDTIIHEFDTIYLYPSVYNLSTHDSLVIATTSCGLYYMSLHDSVWNKIDTYNHLSLLGLFVKDSIILCGTNQKGLIVSHDSGKNWKYITDSIKGYIYIFFNINNVFYAYSNIGLFQSTNNGLSWNDISYILPKGQIENILVIDNKFFANTFECGLLKSNDFGASWDTIGNGLPVRTPYNPIQAIYYFGDTLFVGYKWSGIFKSIDDGQNWQYSSTGIEYAKTYKMISFGDTIICNSHSQGPGLLRSADAGKNWETINNSSIGTSIGSLIKDGNKIYITNKEGLYKSDDFGNTWNQILNSNVLYSVDAEGSTILCGISKHQVIISFDSGANWDTINYDDNYGQVREILIRGNNILASGYDMYLSTDSGHSWKNISKNLYPYISGFGYKEPNIILSTQEDIYASNDNGNTWEIITNNLENFIFAGYTYIADSVVFICFNDIGIWYSIIGKYNWYPYKDGLDATANFFESNGEYFFASTDKGIWRRPYFEWVSISENNNHLTEINIFPNPVSEELKIYCPHFSNNYTSGVIYDILGQELRKFEINGIESKVNISEFDSGIYFVKVIVGNDQVVRKIFKE